MPIIPVVSDPDKPRVVVTNGMPFVPKLDSPDPAPALTTEVGHGGEVSRGGSRGGHGAVTRWIARWLGRNLAGVV